MIKPKQIESALFGVAVGDALGVPVEFKSRDYLKENPIKQMVGYGTYNQPPGTWSDDSSLTFCLAEALTKVFNLKEIAKNFVLWLYEDFWTARGEVFDVGITTHAAINRLKSGVKPDLAGETDESANGNGSLMRILPLIFYTINMPINERFAITQKISCITHGHIRASIACFYYLEFAKLLIEGVEKFASFDILKKSTTNYLKAKDIDEAEIKLFSRLLNENIYDLDESEIQSSGYVLHTLEASIWCLLTTNSYKEAVLKAVNLGIDADTTAAITGGLAGILYGVEKIPYNWQNEIARYKDIKQLAQKLSMTLE